MKSLPCYADGYGAFMYRCCRYWRDREKESEGERARAILDRRIHGRERERERERGPNYCVSIRDEAP